MLQINKSESLVSSLFVDLISGVILSEEILKLKICKLNRAFYPCQKSDSLFSKYYCLHSYEGRRKTEHLDGFLNQAFMESSMPDLHSMSWDDKKAYYDDIERRFDNLVRPNWQRVNFFPESDDMG